MPKKTKRFKDNTSSRRNFLKTSAWIVGGTFLGTMLPVRIITNLDDADYWNRPDKMFFKVADAFSVPYTGGKTAEYMQPPKIWKGSAGCDKNQLGCEKYWSNNVYEGKPGSSTLPHEIGHSVFDKYRMYLQEQYLRGNFGALQEENPELEGRTFKDVLDEYSYHEKSYFGYPDSKILDLPKGLLDSMRPSDPINEYIAYCAAFATMPDKFHRVGAKSDEDAGEHAKGSALFLWTRNAYGVDAVPKVAGAVVKADESYDLNQTDVQDIVWTVVEPIANELGYKF